MTETVPKKWQRIKSIQNSQKNSGIFMTAETGLLRTLCSGPE